MPEIITPPSSRKAILPDWFNTEPGQALLGEQKSALASLLPDKFYRVGLQFGFNDPEIMQDINVETTLYCDTGCIGNAQVENCVIALPEALPLADSSVDLALFFHILDYCADPHRVLREISEALSPEGVLLLTGFHPYSLWGVKRRLADKRAPFDARFISRRVVQDWLRLLGFQTLTACMLNYQVPQLGERWRHRLAWMNKAGDRWWPTLGAVYVLVVQKKIYSGLSVKNRVRPGNKWFPEIKPAQAKIAR
jgi:SAM-dependent methyltransferase